MADVRKTTHSRTAAANKAARRKASIRRSPTARKSTKRAAPKRWSQRATKKSDALDLKQGSSRRTTGAHRSALSMLTFDINRAGKTLPKTQRTRLERAKVELKRAFGRE